MADSKTIRFSQFNASLNRNNEGEVVRDLSTPNNAQAKNVAEIIQRNNPDVLLLNEFDYVAANPLQAVHLFQQNYLSLSQNGATPVEYPYVYIAPSNTGIASGFDLDNNGTVVTTPGVAGYGNDAFGFGNFPGQFGMLLLSKYPIDTENVRTFQNFLWQDMPDSLLPTITTPGSSTPWYSPEEQAALRLSSKSHWDVPIKVDEETVHVLVSHPTPPTFDSLEDRNGKRNHDEIRFWSDYITPGKGNYIYDDAGERGGLSAGSQFVIMGDQNADPFDGDSFDQAILQILNNPHVNSNFIPTSLGGPPQAQLQAGANRNQRGNPAFDTADFADTAPGNLRTDYVLPSADLKINNSGVFWPLNTDPQFPLVGTFSSNLPGGFPSSDHRLVFVDVQLGATEPERTIAGANFLGQTIIPTGFIPPGAAGTVNGLPTPVGGLSGVTYDAASNRYYAISDDRSQFGSARFYSFTANPSTLSSSGITFTDATPLKDANGNLFTLNSLDPEGIALTGRGTVFISSEGEVNLSAGRVTNPFVNEFSLTTGQLVRASEGGASLTLPVPHKFLPVVQDTNGNGTIDADDTQLSGVRNNLAFESLTITPDKNFLFTATENALIQDGPVTSTSNGTRSRILQYNLVTGQPEKEYLYVTDAVALQPNPSNAFNTNGLVDLLAIDNRGTLLALERSFSSGAPGTGNTIKIYEVSLQGATDISTIDALGRLTNNELATIQPAQKRLLLNLDSLSLPTGLDNVEGLAFGPTLPDGRQSIVLVSDNNFSDTQFTQILALGADLVPTFPNPHQESIRGTALDDTLFGSNGNDIIYGLGGNDTIFAGNGDNLVRGGEGNNTLYAGSGNDYFDAGDGNNTFYAGEGNNRIFTGNGSNTIYTGAGNDEIGAGNGNNTIYAGEGLNRITTGAGDDLIFAGAGNDFINAFAGSNTIYAGEGNNTIVSSGIDTIYTGSGEDTFRLDRGAGSATIIGFGSNDKISLGSGLTLNDLTISQSYADTLISAGTDLLATLKWVQASNITSDLFV